jgi:hypothetical protein
MRPNDSTKKPVRTADAAALSFGLSEPRLERVFNPRFYPEVDGTAAPSSDSSQRDELIRREFCAVYYRLNRLHARLTALQTGAPDFPREDRERQLLREIEKHLRIRDELEDRYAPFGVIAEAITREGFTTKIAFTFGDRNILRQQRMQLISSTALLFIPEPE